MSSNCIIIDRVFNLVSFLFHLVFLDIIMIPIDIFVLAVMLIIFFTVCRLLFKNSFNLDADPCEIIKNKASMLIKLKKFVGLTKSILIFKVSS